jgi:hypothetical protein
MRRGLTHMRRLAAAALTGAAFLVTATAASGGHGLELFDHPAPGVTVAVAPVGTGANHGPPGDWQLLTTFATGNGHTDLDFFRQDGEIYASVGTLAVGPNGAGQTIVRLTENDQVGPLTPKFITGHPSAECPSNPLDALGLQHDVEATPKGNVIFNTRFPNANRSEPQLLLDASDAPGRCHDQGPAAGITGAPQGGLELIDITALGRLDNALEPILCPARQVLDDPELKCAVEIGLTSHIGEAHTVNVDPKRPHIAYAVTSDNVTVDQATGRRQNEVSTSSERFDLDGFEVVDLSSCMGFNDGTTVAMKRMLCRPEVYRYRYPNAAMALGHTLKSGSNAIFGCHELEVYPNDRLACGSGNAGMLFDMSGAFDDNGTPKDFTDDKPRGDPLPCRVRPGTSLPAFATGAMVTDCVVGEDEDGGPVDLSVSGWIAIGAPSLEGVRFIGSAFHMGRGGPRDATEDVDFNHEAELSASGRLMIVTDERGGGVSPPGATCFIGGNDINKAGNGGLHAFRVDRLLRSSPAGPTAADVSYARTRMGEKAIYRATPRTGVEPTTCTAHVFHQIPGQNRIFMGWYSQGTQVVDFTEYPNGRVEFEEAGFFIPEEADEWVSAIFKVEKNPNGTFTYYGATGDFVLGTGRNAIDVYKVTLPAPPRPFGQGGDDGEGDEDCPSNDDVDADGLIDARESLLGTLLGNRDSDLDGIADGNDDANGNGEDDEDEDDEDDCPDRDSDGDGEDDEDEDDD